MEAERTRGVQTVDKSVTLPPVVRSLGPRHPVTTRPPDAGRGRREDRCLPHDEGGRNVRTGNDRDKGDEPYGKVGRVGPFGMERGIPGRVPQTDGTYRVRLFPKENVRESGRNQGPGVTRVEGWGNGGPETVGDKGHHPVHLRRVPGSSVGSYHSGPSRPPPLSTSYGRPPTTQEREGGPIRPSADSGH